ncbi:MAG TPA: monovalent cation/H(+) antiporter subunit G [Caulobacterales bacterium]|nr:monovalent cation/H(+) antiporter subunit G [Caulobacterales bacterium]
MSVAPADILDWARLIVGGALAAAGLAFMLGGSIGVLRFPDFYTRLHAFSASDIVGAAFVIAALIVVSTDGGVSLRLVLLGALLIGAAPNLVHLIANAAHAGGLAPLAGPYAAPRPGARKAEPTP